MGILGGRMRLFMRHSQNLAGVRENLGDFVGVAAIGAHFLRKFAEKKIDLLRRGPFPGRRHRPSRTIFCF